MKIAVYCASSTAVPAEALKLGFDLGAQIAKLGHQLVWGGGAISVMGEVARGARAEGGVTIGVIPQRLTNVEFIDNSATEMHVVKDMRERKGLIEKLSDGFIALPEDWEPWRSCLRSGLVNILVFTINQSQSSIRTVSMAHYVLR